MKRLFWTLWVAAMVAFAYRQFILFGSVNDASPVAASVMESFFSKSTPKQSLPRVLAIVFPQFHPDPINDKLWGEGFTDWDNLRKAPDKNRLGFRIPRPAELGYYDLRNTTVRKRQEDLAREYGIDGFVYHHYWFYDPTHPGPNLHAPLMEMLKDGHPDLPFCLHWCQAPWHDTWLGKTAKQQEQNKKRRSTVLQQQYFPDPSDPAVTAHYNWLKQFFHHPNYIKVEGQPVLLVYWWLPKSVPILQQLRRLAIKDGFSGLYICIGMSFTHDELFPPGRDKGQRRNQFPNDLVNKTVAYPYPLAWMEKEVLQVPQWCSNDESNRSKNRTDLITGILAAFDNTPRRTLEEAHLWSADEPQVVVDRFYHSLYAALYYETCCFPTTEDDRFILINSMNEWAEGMCLEPSDVFGYRFLEAIRNAKASVLDSECKVLSKGAAMS